MKWILRKLFPERYAFRERVHNRALYVQSLFPRMRWSECLAHAERKEHEIDLAKQTGELDEYADQIKVVKDFMQKTAKDHP